MVLVIGCIGRKRSGKDTFFEMIKEKYPEAVRVSFADEIKRIASNIFKMDEKLFHDNDMKDKDYMVPWSTTELVTTPRDICIKIGKFFRNEFSENFWVDLAFANANGPIVVITDLRFENEAAYILNTYKDNARLFYIDADERLGPMPPDSDISETSVYKVLETHRENITVVDNNSTIDNYKNQFNKLYII